jgi:hypothetical protein
VAEPPTGPGWAHELKHDGYRLQIHVRDGRVRLYTITGADWSKRYPLIVKAAAKISSNAILDAEVVWLDSDGVAQAWLRGYRLKEAQRVQVGAIKDVAENQKSEGTSGDSRTRGYVLIIPIQFPNFFFCFLYHETPLDALDRKVSLGRA